MADDVKDPRLTEAQIELAKAKVTDIHAHIEHFSYEDARQRLFNAEKDAEDNRNRVYNFLGPVDNHSASDCAERVTTWARLGNKPITVRLTSPGGEVRAGLMVYEILSHVADEMPVKTIALGSADSMAGIILQAGSERLIGAHSSLTIHEVRISTGFAGLLGESLETRKELDKNMDELNSRLVKILCSKAKMTEKELKAKIKGKDWQVHPEDAIKFGFVDGIGWR
jgi:ATP-dependent Clp protease protease subunit